MGAVRAGKGFGESTEVIASGMRRQGETLYKLKIICLHNLEMHQKLTNSPISVAAHPLRVAVSFNPAVHRSCAIKPRSSGDLHVRPHNRS